MYLNTNVSKLNVQMYIYRVDHKKVARFPFCVCPCDILSGVSMYIA